MPPLYIGLPPLCILQLGGFLLSNIISVRESNLDTSIIYIKGNATTNGSVRLLVDDICQIELRTGGVWNTTKFRTGGGSLEIARDMSLSALAGFLETINPSQATGHRRSLVPHIEMDDLTGTTANQLHVPIANIVQTFVVFSTAVSEKSGTTIGQILGVTPGRSLKTSIHEVGTVGASADVTVNIYTGTDNTGTKVSTLNFPPSDLVANTTFTIDYEEVFGFDAGVSYFQEFVSTASFTLKTDSGGNVLTTQVGHEMDELTAVTDNLTLSNNLDLTFSNNLELTYGNQF